MAWEYGFSKFGLIDGSEEEVFRFWDIIECEDSGALSDSFDNKYAGHNRVLREVSLELRFIKGYIFESFNIFFLDLDNFIDEQEWVSMRYTLGNIVYILDIRNSIFHNYYKYN